MDQPQPSPARASTDELLAQSGWLRSLARGLVRDRGVAEDVVQETWLAALSHAPGEPGRLKPWLAHVLANFARKQRRSGARRVEREARAARPDAWPSASEIATRLESQRLLVEALDVLEEPYKTTVVLRYFDGLEASEIARREGVPAGTVRWRLHEGLERLRARLDARSGGERAGWALMCLPFVPPPSLFKLAGLAGAASIGVVIMSTSLRVAFVGLALLASALGVWLWVQEPEGAGPRASESRAAEQQHEPEARTGAPLERGESGSEREVPVAERERASKPAPVVATAALGPTVVEGRCIDADRRALAHVSVTDKSQPESSALSTPDGRFHLELSSRVSHWGTDIVARLAEHATTFKHVELDPGQVHELGDLVLAPGATVFGRVVDDHGQALAGAQILVAGAELVGDLEETRRIGPTFLTRAPETLSAPGGEFEIAGAPARLVRVLAGLEGKRWSVTEPFELVAHERHGPLELVLEPLETHDRIAGIVLDPDGAPVPSCGVQYHYEDQSTSGTASLSTGPDGRFTLELEHDVPHDFLARDKRWPDAIAEKVPQGTLELVLRFAPARWCDLAVRDPDGKAVTEFRIELDALTGGQDFSVRERPAQAAGHKQFSLPTARFRISVDAPGFELAHLGPFDPLALGETLVCTLQPLPGLRGRVVRAGQPVAGARLELHKLIGPGDRVVHNGYLSRLEPSPLQRTESDAEGRFVLTPRERANYALLAESAGSALCELDLADVDPAVGASELVIDLVAGGSIEGRVLLPAGQDPAGTIVGFDRHDGRPRTLRADKDGRFRVDGLTPGDWLVQQAEHELRHDSSTTSWQSGGAENVEYASSCKVANGVVTPYDLDLRHASSTVLEVHALLDGQPAVGWRVRAWLDSVNVITELTPTGATSSSGELSLALARPARYRVEIEPPPELAKDFELFTTLELADGPNPWNVTLESSSLAGELGPQSGEQRVTFEWSGPAGLRANGSLPVDAQGHFGWTFVPAGELELHCFDVPADGNWIPRGSKQLTLHRGERAAVRLP